MKIRVNNSLLFSTIISAFAFIVFVYLLHFPFWKNMENWSYDWLSVYQQPNIEQTDIIIVTIDIPSFQQIGLQWPWPRAIHANLVNNLTKAGAKAIAFDVIFSDPSLYGKEDDDLFATAIEKSKRVILASDNIWQESKHGILQTRVEPKQQFKDAGALPGLVHVRPDNDGFLRHIPTGKGMLWQVIRDYLKLDERQQLNIPNQNNLLIHYLGGSNTFPSVHYYQALDPELVDQTIFRDRLVLVGLDLRDAPEIDKSSVDRFKTPYYRLNAKDTAGVEVHANILENIKHNLYITSLSKTQHIILLFLIALFSALLFSNWTVFKSSIYFLIIVSLLTIISLLAFIYLKLWVPVISSILLLIFIYNANALAAYLRERNQKLFLHNAFSRYVSSKIMKDIMDNPEKLKLGGERREVTLLFTDIAGFTTISEQLPAEQTARLLNQYLSKMSKIITKHGGTLDKYIGDAIMAFWGAPLDDKHHAYNACQAAVEMQNMADTLRKEYIKQGYPEVRMRIGIHTGEAIIGNMGSTELFDYSAIGDNVNLAARLEGVNKQYDTWIMISEVTASLVKDKFNLQSVDKVCVKGKTQAIEIFTFAKNKNIAELSNQAMQYYLQQKWKKAKQLWTELLQQEAKNSIARLYLQRIESYQNNPPEKDWKGITILTSK